MTISLRDWVRRTARRLQPHEQQEPLSPTEPAKVRPVDSLPVLPSHRRPITPSFSSLSPFSSFSASRDTSATANSLFFQRLPPELRRQIYQLAFGSRSIHVDLVYSRAVLHGRHSNAETTIEPRSWQWRSAPCHRRPEVEVFWDRCYSGGYPTDCPSYDDGCRIGAMGWLLTCRQAYVEGLDLFLSTNTFHIASGAVVLFSHSVFVPHRVDSITSVALVWENFTLSHHARGHLGLSPGWPAYRALVSAIPSAFPRLQKLYFAVWSRLIDWPMFSESQKEPLQGLEAMDDETRNRMLEEGFVGPLDQVARIYGEQLTEFQVATAGQIFDVLAVDAQTAGLVESGGEAGLGQWERFWRAAGTPQPENLEPANKLGYWIRKIPTTAQVHYFGLLSHT